MPSFELLLDARRTDFLPGETLSGTAAWQLDAPPESVEIRLFWYTEGRGDQDVGIIDSVAVDRPETNDRRSFAFTLPAGPPSCSGALISLIWAIEVVVEPGAVTERWNLVVGPGRREVRLTAIAPDLSALPSVVARFAAQRSSSQGP
jgi:hypothetical protein